MEEAGGGGKALKERAAGVERNLDYGAVLLKRLWMVSVYWIASLLGARYFCLLTIGMATDNCASDAVAAFVYGLHRAVCLEVAGGGGVMRGVTGRCGIEGERARGRGAARRGVSECA